MSANEFGFTDFDDDPFADLASIPGGIDFAKLHADMERPQASTTAHMDIDDLDFDDMPLMGVPTSDEVAAEDEERLYVAPENPARPPEADTVEGTVENMLAYFPFPFIRPTQRSIFEAVATARVGRRKFTLIEAPTGVGKTGVSLTVGLHAADYPSPLDGPDTEDGATILTSQKSLSAQMVADFGSKGLVELRGKRNYTCDTHRTNCEDGSALNQGSRPCSNCPYRRAKNKFIGAPVGVTNYSYFITETQFGGQLPTRDRLILDEAHNVEREILAVANITVTQTRLNLLGVDAAVPSFEAGREKAVRAWLLDNLYPKLEAYIDETRRQAERAERAGDEREIAAIAKELNDIVNYRIKLDRFTGSPNLRDWLAWTDEERVLNIKPLVPAIFAHELLFKHAKNVLLMSATMLDFSTVRKTLGILPSQSVQFQAASEFPRENRRIKFWPTGSMGFKNIRQTMPDLQRRIGLLLSTKYPDKKGIIHTHTYRINDELVQYLHNLDPIYRRRIITHNRKPESREQAIMRHLTSPEPTVLVSPSMTEGLDLKDDLSRFQIITKVPYPFLDPYNKARMERNPEWYRLQTAITLMQATGRSIRSTDDHALTVILDSDFGRFLSDAGSILPQWWTSAIEVA